ncbi:MAG TPA: hypothetical protein VMX16_19935 [Terriglobia bacterium]|nr:hypothetical protein [Terriglobia bacterium]
MRSLPFLFLFSGASSLVFETIFTRLLTYSFGNTAQAVSTVLAAFLGGLALGAYVFGNWVDARRPSLWIYGTLELMVGVYGIFIPRLFSLTTRIYVGAYHAFHFGPGGLLAVRFFLAAAVIAAPAALMGGTLPVLARYLSAHQQDFLGDIDRLYAVNTWGAAAGTLASTYFFMPKWGVLSTLGIACAINFSIFCFVALSARGPKEHPQSPGYRRIQGDSNRIWSPSKIPGSFTPGGCLFDGGHKPGLPGHLDPYPGLHGGQHRLCLRVHAIHLPDWAGFGSSLCGPPLAPSGFVGTGACALAVFCGTGDFHFHSDMELYPGRICPGASQLLAD